MQAVSHTGCQDIPARNVNKTNAIVSLRLDAQAESSINEVVIVCRMLRLRMWLQAGLHACPSSVLHDSRCLARIWIKPLMLETRASAASTVA